MTVVALFDDRARSGASIMGRDGLLSMMEAARARQFDVLIVEALDRLSRDQEDLPAIYKRLNFAGIEIRAVHDGIADQMQVGIRGLVGALFLQDLAHKVRRGMEGVTRDGRHAGGRAYGYRAVPGKPGELEIVEEEAAIVRRIFGEYAAGRNARDIASDLNAEGVAPPRGAQWMASSLTGNKQRGHGILVNPLYGGEIVWNRVRMVKDPDTGKRVSRINPVDEWQRADAPHLAIVDAETLAAVRARNGALGERKRWMERRSKHLLSGLLKCGCCGAGMSVKDRSAGRVRIHCTAAKEGSTCTSRKSFYLDRIESAVLEGLKSRLGSREAIAAYLAAYNEERRTLAHDSINAREKAQRRLATITAEHDRTVNLLVKGILSEDTGAATLRRLEAERDALMAEMQAMAQPPKIIDLHPAAVREYLDTIAQLEDALRQQSGHEASAMAPVRRLIERVTVSAGDEGRYDLAIEGRLNSLIGGDQYPSMKLGGLMVAEEGFEPPTHGL